METERYEEYLEQVTEEEGLIQYDFYQKYLRNNGTAFLKFYSDEDDLMYSFPNTVGTMSFSTIDKNDHFRLGDDFNPHDNDNEYRSWDVYGSQMFDGDKIDEELFIKMIEKYKLLMVPYFAIYRDELPASFDEYMINKLMDFENDYNVEVGIDAHIPTQEIDGRYTLEEITEEMERNEVDSVDVELIWFEPSESLYEIEDFNVNLRGG